MSSDTSPRDPARSPKTVPLGKYKVLAHIATGGMGAVYRALDTETGQEVAVKVLNQKMASNPLAVERFYREARNAAQLRHENIVSVFEAGEHRGVIYLSMEFVEGTDLADYIYKQGRLDIEEARTITFQAARALLHAFKRGIVHRDIKPSNFLLNRTEGRLIVKMTDLGLSRQTHEDEFRLTREGSTVGTIDYIAPEQARDSGSADIRADIYSLGCTLYHMLTGQPPFPDGGLGERIYKHLEVEPTDVRELRPEVPAGLAKVVQRMLAKKPEDRYQSPRELLHALTLATKEPRRESRKRKPDSMDTPPEGIGPRLISTEPRTPPEREPRPRAAAPSTEIESPAKPTRPRPRAKKAPSNRNTWILVAAGACTAILALVILLIVIRGGGPADPDPDERTPPDDGAHAGPPIKPKPKDPPEVVKEKDPPKQGTESVWPPLRPGLPVIDRDELTRRFQAGPDLPKPTDDVPIYRVARLSRDAGQYQTLAEAIRAIQEKGGVGAPRTGKSLDAIVEIQDNGPIYEAGLTVIGKSILVRAAAGFRPLLFWDLERHVDKSAPPLFSVQDGNIGLEGLEIVLHSPRAAAGPLAFLHVTRGDVVVRGCSFSAAGTHPPGVVLVRQDGSHKEGRPIRCRISRCLARGGSLAALDCEVGSRDILIDDSLLTGGVAPQVSLQLRPENRAQLLLLRSTLVSRGSGVRVVADDSVLPPDTFRCLAWDSVLSHTGAMREGALLELPASARSESCRWQGVNCLYTGWRHLLRGPAEIDGVDSATWEKHRSAFGVERMEREPWPAATFPELAEVPAQEYRTDRAPGAPVGYASTSWPALAADGKPATIPPTIGCPVGLLPLARDRWPQWTVERFRAPTVDMVTDSSVISIPSPGDNLYHGERLDLSRVDLGARLAEVQQTRKIASRVVLHLFQSVAGRKISSSPIRVKKVDLVLFMETQKNADRLILQGDGRTGGTALIEVEKGNLDIIGGEIRVPDFSDAGSPAWLVKVVDGSLRTNDTHLYGAVANPSGTFEGAILLERNQETRPLVLAMHQSVIVSPRRGIQILGKNTRLRMVQGVIVAGTDALALDPGLDAGSRLDHYTSLDRVTVAAGRSVVAIGETPTGMIEEPLLVQTRACAFLNPLLGRGGMLLASGADLRRGVVLWQGEGDLYDKRLHFAAATPRTIPEKAEPFSVWLSLWGPAVARKAQGEFPQGPRFEKDRWPLDRLALTPLVVRPNAYDTRGIGADLDRLGLLRKSNRPK